MKKNTKNEVYYKIYNFMKMKNIFFFISGLLIMLSLTSLYIKGLNLGVDFKGGTLIQIQYKNKAPISEIRNIILKDKKFSSSTVSKFGSERELTIKTIISSSSINEDLNKYLKNILKNTGEFKIRRIDMVGPKVGNELKEKGFIALLLALIGIFIYVSLRFEWKFSIGAVIPLFHDVLITLGILSFLQIEVNLDVLAAILTIIGYSLNDTIIIFDRIRENVRKSKDKFEKIIDLSISATVSRTLLTSLTTLFVVLTLYLFGGEIMKPFSFTLMIGIIIGTYSSIYIASSSLILLNFDVKKYQHNLLEKEKVRKEKERMREQFSNGII